MLLLLLYYYIIFNACEIDAKIILDWDVAATLERVVMVSRELVIVKKLK